MKLNKLELVLNEICPLYLSKAFIEQGHHDNSGTLIRVSEEVNKILFSLDLSVKAVEKAVEIGADTIITHHPAIYYPVSTLDINGETKPLVMAIKSNINVISMHLNLDIAKGGIDDELAYSLGGKKLTTVTEIVSGYGYGKEFTLNTTLKDLKEKIINTLGTDKVFVYGDLDKKVTSAVSFCGGGSSDAVKYQGNAEVVVTADIPHHIIKEILEKNKFIIQLTHFSAENFGFKKFYEKVKSNVGETKCVYFTDERFN